MYKAIDRWFPSYIRSLANRRTDCKGTRHLYFAIADHFEPRRDGISQADSRKNVAEWLARYEKHFDALRASDGSRPKQTLFYPAEEYDPAVADMLAGFRDRGGGDVEIHLHHRNDTEEGLREKLVTFRDKLFHQHGLLRKGEYLAARAPALDPDSPRGRDADDQPTNQQACPAVASGEVRIVGSCLRESVAKNSSSIIYGFVHGNWALCNTRPDGDWCGVNNEIAVLKETGCYADFTFPSAPSPTQPRVVNRIYYAANKEEVQGAPSLSTVHGHPSTGLMLVTGPLTLDWQKRKYGFLPGLENGSIDAANPASPHRADLWTGCNIHVEGRPDHVFVKVHTHGLVPTNADSLFGGSLLDTYRHILAKYDDGIEWKLHFVTCYEMYQAICRI